MLLFSELPSPTIDSSVYQSVRLVSHTVCQSEPVQPVNKCTEVRSKGFSYTKIGIIPVMQQQSVSSNSTAVLFSVSEGCKLYNTHPHSKINHMPPTPQHCGLFSSPWWYGVAPLSWRCLVLVTEEPQRSGRRPNIDLWSPVLLQDSGRRDKEEASLVSPLCALFFFRLSAPHDAISLFFIACHFCSSLFLFSPISPPHSLRVCLSLLYLAHHHYFWRCVVPSAARSIK